MKKTALLVLALSIGLMASAQTTFESYMKRVPALPEDSCNISKASAEDFVQQVSDLLDELINDIEERERRSDDYAEENQGDMEANAMKMMQQKYGMSDEDLNKMKNGKEMSDAETQAMANKMVMQQTNMSMAEIQNMSKMSEAGKKAYAEAYATEAMANAKADPGKYASDNNAKSLYSLTNEQRTLNQKIVAGQQKIANMYTAIENDPSGKAMLAKMSEWNNKLTSMMGEVSDYEAHIIDSLVILVEKEAIQYCDKFTPQYRTALRKDLANLKASIPDCNRLDQVTGELMKLQTGVDAPPDLEGISSLGALKTYLGHLEKAYKYKLNYSENN